MQTSILQEGVTEKTGHNDGIEIRGYLRSVGLGEGNPYCIAGQIWTFVVNGGCPFLRSGLASAVFNDAKKRGRRTDFFPRDLDLIFWKFARTPQGHAGRIKKVKRAGWLITNEYNTSSGRTTAAKERDGGAVRERNRNWLYDGGRIGTMLLAGFVGCDSTSFTQNK